MKLYKVFKLKNGEELKAPEEMDEPSMIIE